MSNALSACRIEILFIYGTNTRLLPHVVLLPSHHYLATHNMADIHSSCIYKSIMNKETKMFRAWWNTYLITNHFDSDRWVYMVEEDGMLTKCTYHTFYEDSPQSYYKWWERYESPTEIIPMIEWVMDRPIVWERRMVFHVDEWEKIPHTYWVFRSLNWDIKVFYNAPWEFQVWRYIDSIPYKAILDSNNYPPETVERITKLFKEWNWL